MTIENISWLISTKECCRPRRGLNPLPPGLQSDGGSRVGGAGGGKTNDLHPLRANSSPLEYIILRRDLVLDSKQEVTKVVSLAKNGRKSTKRIQPT